FENAARNIRHYWLDNDSIGGRARLAPEPRQGATYSALVFSGRVYFDGAGRRHWGAAAPVAGRQLANQPAQCRATGGYQQRYRHPERGQPGGREAGVYRVRKHVFGYPGHHALQLRRPRRLLPGPRAAHLRARRGADSHCG
nr:hypothetical protein [Tanacetum cinerariifolium]